MRAKFDVAIASTVPEITLNTLYARYLVSLKYELIQMI